MDIIIGSGFAGLLAACKFKRARVIEAAAAPVERHQAVLRFRSDSAAKLTGIPFEKVCVRKAVFSEGKLHHQCNIRMANQYALKTGGSLSGERSIWNLEPGTRWIAPKDFYWQLIRRLDEEKRITFGCEFDPADQLNNKVLSTISLAQLLPAIGLEAIDLRLSSKEIQVTRCKLDGVRNVYQTIYFPDPRSSVYRASITDDTLIVEWQQRDGATTLGHGELVGIQDAFGVSDRAVSRDDFTQRDGKIIELPATERRKILHELTVKRNIFSVGRFATWRNIMLDDVVKDLDVIERLSSLDGYSLLRDL